MSSPGIVQRWSSSGPQLQSVLRIVAAFLFLLAGEMAVADFQFHQPKGLWPIVNGGTDAAILCFVWLCFSTAGAGPWSVDALRRGARD